MNLFIKLSLAILLVALESCDSTKTAANDEAMQETTSKQQETKQDIMQEGYSVGTIKYLSNSKCPYIIVDEKTGAKFDPINMQEERFADYKKDQQKVFYKYRPLRMMNRCEEAQPIEIEDIKKRED